MAQLGSIKIQTDSGIVDVPVFNVGDSGGSTVEALRVQTDSGEGFVPLVDPADAASPQEAIRVQTDSGIKAVHDAATVGPPIIDDFEDQNLSEYVGDTGTVSVVSSPVSNGSFAIKSNSEANIISQTLTNRPERGDSFEFDVRVDNNNSNPGVLFGVPSGTTSNTDGYLLQPTDQQNGIIELFKIQNGNFTTLASQSISAPTGQYLTGRVEWSTTNTITCTTKSLSGNVFAQISASDSTFAAEDGFGFRFDPDGPSFFDFARIV
jgi:hypothetical protein